MAMFQAEIAFLLELALFAAGLVLLHLGKQWTASLVRAAGFVLVIGAVLTAACTTYYAVRYQLQGEFDSAYAPHARMAMEGGKTTHPGMMMRHEMMREGGGRREGTGG